jgi:hypothetical protein
VSGGIGLIGYRDIGFNNLVSYFEVRKNFCFHSILTLAAQNKVQPLSHRFAELVNPGVDIPIILSTVGTAAGTPNGKPGGTKHRALSLLLVRERVHQLRDSLANWPEIKRRR